MDEQEFQRLLEIFPTVRSRDFYLELDTSRQSTSQSKQKEEVKPLQDGQSKGSIESNTRAVDHGEAFWGKLKAVAEKKVACASGSDKIWWQHSGGFSSRGVRRLIRNIQGSNDHQRGILLNKKPERPFGAKIRWFLGKLHPAGYYKTEHGLNCDSN